MRCVKRLSIDFIYIFYSSFYFQHAYEKSCVLYLIDTIYKCMICRRQSHRLLYVMNFFIFQLAFGFFLSARMSGVPFVYRNSFEFCMIINMTSIFCTLFTHTPIGSAIKCFECNSHYNQGCEVDDVPSNFSVDCSLKQDRDDRNKPIQYTLCRKVLQVIEFSVNQCK